jgi:Rrf2 family protein
MLAFNKKVHYALIAINYLAQRPDRIASAREIAAAHNLPLALLMNILKELHHKKVVRSQRGTRGGYSLNIDMRKYTLHDLIKTTSGPVHMSECAAVHASMSEIGDGNSGQAASMIKCTCKVQHCPMQGSMKSLHQKLVRFFEEVKLADIIKPPVAKKG